MLTEEKKDYLAELNEFGNDRYRDRVKEDIRKKMTAADELAILRKAVAYLFELISKLHSGDIENDEFAIYHAIIEQIKSVERSKYNS